MTAPPRSDREDDRSVDRPEHAAHVVGIGVEVADRLGARTVAREVDGDRGDSRSVKERDDSVPAPRAVPRAVYEDDRGALWVLRHLLKLPLAYDVYVGVTETVSTTTTSPSPG